jgi:plastocyanin
MLSLVACQPAPLPNTGNSQPQNQASSQTINLANISFNPKETTIKAGTTVIWMNKDNMAHTVTADDKSFDSGNLNPGDTFKFTFAKAGTYHFYCRYHGGPNGQGMSGTIVVTGQ